MLIHLIVPTARGRLAHRTALGLQQCLAYTGVVGVAVEVILRPGDGGLDAIRYVNSCDSHITPVLIVADKTYSDVVVKRTPRWHSVRPLVQLALDQVALWITSSKLRCQLGDLASIAGGRICGDGSGGLDDVLVKALALSLNANMPYIPLQGRGAAAIQTLEGRAAAFVSSRSQERESVLSGTVQRLDPQFEGRLQIPLRIPVSAFVRSCVSEMMMDELAAILKNIAITSQWKQFLQNEALEAGWMSRAAHTESLAQQRSQWTRVWSQIEQSKHVHP